MHSAATTRPPSTASTTPSISCAGPRSVCCRRCAESRARSHDTEHPPPPLETWLFMRPSRLDQTFAALADPTRRALLARLAGGEAGVMQLAKPFRMSQPAISKHLKVLERAGLIV